VDSNGIEQQPIVGNRPIWALYFCFFIVVGAFFILNLFDGVVVDNFNREKDKLAGMGDLSSGQRLWTTLQVHVSKHKMTHDVALPNPNVYPVNAR